jgi:hypothetical protein
MKEFDDLMYRLRAYLYDGGSLQALEDAYEIYKSAYEKREPLVLEQVDELSLPPDDGSTEGRLDMTDEGTFYFRGISYRLPEEK